MIAFPQRTQPSWKGGFARSRGESAFPNLWKGLVAAYMPSFGPTGLELKDVTSNKNHGTLTNMDAASDWVVGEKGYALDFDGTNDHVFVDINTTVPRIVEEDAGSISMWVNHNVRGAAHYSFYDSNFYTIFLSGGDLFFRAGKTSGGNQQFSIDESVVDLGVWQYFVMTWVSGSTFLGYIDGIEVGSGAAAGTDDPGVGDLYIGSLEGGASNNFNGQISDVHIYNRPLTADEIQQLFIDHLAPFRRQQHVPLSAEVAATAALTGTVTATIDEVDIVAGGKTAILTLTGDTWVTG